MPSYQYKAYRESGEVEEGEIEALDDEAAVNAIFSKGLYPFETLPIQEQKDVPWWDQEVFGSGGISRRDLSEFSRDMATLLAAELPLDETLRIIQENASSRRMRQITARILSKVLDGASLSKALEFQGDSFPEFYSSIVQAGEASGSLGDVFSDLSSFLEQSLKTRSQIQSALVYPAVLLVVACITIVVLLTTLIPNIAPLFEDQGADMPLFVELSLSFQTAFYQYWEIIISGVIATILGGSMLLRNDEVRSIMDRLILRLPLIGVLFVGGETARITRTLATLLRNGVPLVSALSIVHPVCKNRMFAEAVRNATQLLQEGKNLRDAFTEADIFPDPTIRLVALGERAGNLEVMLLHIATIFETRVQTRINILMTALTPIITLTIGLGVGALIVSVMTAILSVNDLAFQ